MNSILNPLRWLGRNLGVFILALGLAIIVWVTSVVSVDPNQECVKLVPLEFVGQGEDLLYLGERPDEVRVQILSLQSICNTWLEDQKAVQAQVNLTGLEEGDHTVGVDLTISQAYQPFRLLDTGPTQIEFSFEKIITRTLPIQFDVIGTAAPGFSTSLPIWSASRVTFTGRKSLVDTVEQAVVSLDIANADADIDRTLTVQLVDVEENLVTGLELSPASVDVKVGIGRPGTFRDVTIKVNTIGQPAEGYRLTNITTSPQVITLFSSNPQDLRELPGFVETQSVDLTNATNDIERRVALILPEGVSVFGEQGQSIFVQIGVAAIIANATRTLDVELIGLSPGFEVTVTPLTVDVILSGPAILFDELLPEDVRAVVDLTGLEAGTHTIEPTIDILPIEVSAVSIQPATVEVTIELIPTITATPTLSFTLTTTPSITPALLPTLTPTP